MGKTKMVFNPTTGELDTVLNPAVTGYQHEQITPAAVWTINHKLGFKPGGVQVTDSGGNDWVGEVDHLDANNLTVTFTAPFAGTAFIS